MSHWEIIVVATLFIFLLADIGRLLRSVCDKLDTINKSLQELKTEVPMVNFFSKDAATARFHIGGSLRQARPIRQMAIWPGPQSR
jgi:uncharacterized protein (DUF3084 family)